MSMPEHIVVCDDEPDIRELLEITLGRMDIETNAAKDVTEAKQLLGNNTYDLCLTDMKLPDGNGIELYWDRAPELWETTEDGHVEIINAPLDVNTLVAEGLATPA